MHAFIRSLAVLGVLAIGAQAQTNVYWDFNGESFGNPTRNTGSPHLHGGAIEAGNWYRSNDLHFDSSQHSDREDYYGINGPASENHNASVGIVGGALAPATSTYFEFTLAPSSGYQLSATDFQLGSRSNFGGPTTLTLLASEDGFATAGTLLDSKPVLADSHWHLITFTPFSFTGAMDTPVTFRLYGTSAAPSDDSTNWRIDDVTLGVVAVPEPSTYASLLVGVGLLGARALRRRKSGVA